jgi:hypothetical protein
MIRENYNTRQHIPFCSPSEHSYDLIAHLPCGASSSRMSPSLVENSFLYTTPRQREDRREEVPSRLRLGGEVLRLDFI